MSVTSVYGHVVANLTKKTNPESPLTLIISNIRIRISGKVNSINLVLRQITFSDLFVV